MLLLTLVLLLKVHGPAAYITNPAKNAEGLMCMALDVAIFLKHYSFMYALQVWQTAFSSKFAYGIYRDWSLAAAAITLLCT